MSWDQPVRDEAYWADLRRKANQNLLDIAAGKYKKEPREPKKSELERAEAWEIQLGHDVLERRQYSKLLHRLFAKKEMTQEELGWAEEYQSWIDRYDEDLNRYSRDELKRFVRLWNKSRKTRYVIRT